MCIGAIARRLSDIITTTLHTLAAYTCSARTTQSPRTSKVQRRSCSVSHSATHKGKNRASRCIAESYHSSQYTEMRRHRTSLSAAMVQTCTFHGSLKAFCPTAATLPPLQRRDAQESRCTVENYLRYPATWYKGYSNS